MAAVKKSAKKFAKKAAKKTYPPAKKTVPKPKWVTAKELSAIMVETFDRMAAHSAETEAKMAVLRAEIEAELAARRAEIEAESAKRHAEIEAESAKRRAAMEADHAKTEAVLRELAADIRKTTKTVNDSYGKISMRLGRVTELIVMPKMRLDMNSQGHNFDGSEVDKLIRGVVGDRKEDIAEVDMFLRGPTEAMAVEIKTRLRDTNVSDHLEQLRVLREHEEDAGIKGRKLYGAVVGIVIDEHARRLAKENGLYVVEIREEEGKLNIDKPEPCRAW